MHKFSPESNECLICSSQYLRRFKANASDAKGSNVNIIECKSCTFAWQFPLGRSEQQSVEWFAEAYKDKGQSQSTYFNPERKLEIAKLEFEFIESLPVNNKTILDIGAGSGAFAEIAAKNSWTVTAVDPAMDSNHFENNPKVNSIKGTIQHIPATELFSVVTLWDVIEHTQTPRELILNAKSHIQDDGWLVIETGNYKSADRGEQGINHWIYQLDHRWYFSPDSIKCLLLEAGFTEFILCERVLRPGPNQC